MSEDFGKWLKGNKESRPCDVDSEGSLTDFEDVVSVRALGEWAFESWNDGNEYQGELFAIAVACLGRKEVERRLCGVGRE